MMIERIKTLRQLDLRRITDEEKKQIVVEKKKESTKRSGLGNGEGDEKVAAVAPAAATNIEEQ